MSGLHPSFSTPFWWEHSCVMPRLFSFIPICASIPILASTMCLIPISQLAAPFILSFTPVFDNKENVFMPCRIVNSKNSHHLYLNRHKRASTQFKESPTKVAPRPSHVAHPSDRLDEHPGPKPTTIACPDLPIPNSSTVSGQRDDTLHQ